MNTINQMPDFMAMAEQLKKDLQSDAEMMGTDFIHNNFYTEGWHGSSFEPWQPKKISNSYQLLRVTNYLFNSIGVTESNPDRVVWEADAPYAQIHNEGGVLNIPITTRSRKYFWFMFYATGDEKWKGMALTKKQRFTVHMEKRQFMGDSEAFNQQWNDHVSNEILSQFKNHLNTL
ncbi:hypothetical protein [Formosa sp. A9]|uniref:hypothetical protein n=1 Tax=Formosa sp. A9 TaxID=3442641 RepID=UPI003EB9DED5